MNPTVSSNTAADRTVALVYPNWARDWIICGTPSFGPWAASSPSAVAPRHVPATIAATACQARWARGPSGDNGIIQVRRWTVIWLTRLAPREHGITRLVLAEATARQETTGRPDARRRAAALAPASPALDPGHPDTAEAAAYPETVKVAAALLRAPGALPGGPE